MPPIRPTAAPAVTCAVPVRSAFREPATAAREPQCAAACASTRRPTRSTAAAAAPAAPRARPARLAGAAVRLVTSCAERVPALRAPAVPSSAIRSTVAPAGCNAGGEARAHRACAPARRGRCAIRSPPDLRRNTRAGIPPPTRTTAGPGATPAPTTRPATRRPGGAPPATAARASPA
jgi:hypothetical protein